MQRLADPTGETVGRHIQWRNLSDKGAQKNHTSLESRGFKKISKALFFKDASFEFCFLASNIC